MRADQAVTRYEIAAWISTGLTLILVLRLQLLTALLGGLLVYELVHVLARSLIIRRLTSTRARMVAVVLLSVVIITVITLAVLGIVAFLRSDAGSLTALMTKLAEILESSRAYMAPWMVSQLPPDAEALKNATVNWLRSHASDVESMGRGLGRILLQLAIGMIIGAMISLREAEPDVKLRPFAAALLERVHRLADAFRRVLHQVDEHLLDLLRIGANLRSDRVFERKRDVGFLEFRRQQRLDLAQRFLRLDRDKMRL